MKRTLLAGAAAVGVATLLLADPLSANNGKSPHSGEGAHPHHVVNESGCHDVQAPNMTGTGTHQAALTHSGDHDTMHHGSCESHGHLD